MNIMISKQSTQVDFGNEMFESMDKVLKENYAHVRDITQVKVASVKKTALAELTDTLVAVASQLDDLKHPARGKVDNVLRFIETDILK